MVTAATEVASQSVPIAATAGVLAELAQRYKHLKDAETAVFDVLRRLAAGEIYTVWVDEDDLLDAMDSEMDRDDRMRLLANMMSRGILEHGPGKWRAVP